MTARDLWAWRVGETPDRTFLLWEGRSWTFAQTDAIVRRLAGGLASLGVERDTRVLLGVSNRIEMVWLQLALQQLGAVFVPLLGSLTFDELAYQIDHSESVLLVADEPVATTVLPRLGELERVRRIVVTSDVDGGVVPAGAVVLDELLSHEPIAPPPLPGHGHLDLMTILYTSGSTGRPKGVMLPTGCIGTVGESFSERYDLGPDDNFILPVTLSHALGAVTAVGIAVVNGARLTVLDRFSPSSWWRRVAEVGATTSILFPAHLNLLLELEAAAPAAGETGMKLLITHAWNDRFRERFGVELATVWGMTETGALCVGSRPGERVVENYVGTPMLGVEIKVADDELAPVPAGTAGEICLRGEHVMLGYLKNAEATESTLVDGWVRSGDLGFLDDEGRLYFAGRLKNVIKRSGENVSAEEVEGALAEVPGVAESLVFAVPDRLRAEEVGAVLVAKPGVELDPPAVVQAIAGKLARWKLPRYVAVTPEPLPRLGNGKVDRLRAKQLLDPERSWDRERAEVSVERG